MDKVPNVVLTALRATIEVLAGEFGDHKVDIASIVVEVFHVSLELIEPDVVPMDTNVGGLEGDLIEPLLNPFQTFGCRGGRGRAEEGVSLVCERDNERVPHPGACTDVHEGLAVLVDPAMRRK